ncbi:signal peptidase II [Pelagibacteraceae bacterium]|jgi:signal peptidase II|nr:signal peptidase II [Pelagibacteraceae bacterium]
MILKNLKNKILLKETMISLLVISFVFSFDRITKKIIINNQLNNQGIFVNDYLNFELVWNTGISFGLLSQDANTYYHLISLLIFSVIIFLIYLIIKSNFLEKILFSIILGGALGNFFDRIFYFAVPDFIDFHINDFHWFTFNIADIFITVGVILLIINDLILNKK